ncbi:MAG: Fe(3+) ABC transporter substrate-binding protein, partial [gamma proteobacterium symbiont of Ctena orbiculata]
LEFLLDPASQAWYAETNGEFPVRADVEPGELLKGWGEFKMDKLNLQQLGLLNPDAVRLMDRAGWK